MRVPVHVIGGFLGAGKTTALLSLLGRKAGSERAAVVINDFGESAVDEGRVDAAGVAVREIRGGCVCCTAPEGFMGAVGQILDEESPDRIYIEPTGLARPADLIDTLRRAPYADRLDIKPLIILVDPHNLASDLHVAQQAEVADILVANRIDLASDEEMQAFDVWVGGLWPRPLQVHRVEHGELPETVLSGSSSAPAPHDHDHPHHGHDDAHHGHDHAHHDDDAIHGHRVRTWIWPAHAIFDRRRLLAALETLQAASRVKGIFRTEEGVARFDVAGGVLHEAPSDYRRDSRVDVIARDEALIIESERLFSAALRTDEEQLIAGSCIEFALPDGVTRRFDRAAIAALPDPVADVSILVPDRAGVAARISSLFAAASAPLDSEIVVVAADGYATPPVPARAVQNGLLLHTLDGEPLPAGKGGPFRLLIPGDAGPGGPCANVKAVVRIALRTQ